MQSTYQKIQYWLLHEQRQVNQVHLNHQDNEQHQSQHKVQSNLLHGEVQECLELFDDCWDQ